MAAQREGYLERTQIEVPVGGSYRWAPGWKIVDANGVDLVQPYERKKTDARKTAAALNIKIMGEQA